MRFSLLLLLLLGIACKTEVEQKKTDAVVGTQVSTADYRPLDTPDQLLGELFVTVQMQQIFPDSKTFVDCTAKFPYDQIKAAYEAQKNDAGFDLKAFVETHFEIPPSISSDFKSRSHEVRLRACQ